MNPNRPLGIWLAIWAAMLFVLIQIGGATRLTESGLSITEWQPVSGVIPPLTHADWEEEFARYRQIPQYQAIHADMTLDQFKTIFLWEYTHRLWARLVGVAFLLPLLWFLFRGMVPRDIRGRLWLLLLLLAAQGALGWFMVSSGLSGRIEVSQYRLAAHFAAALLIYGATVWTAAGFLASPEAKRADVPALRRSAATLTGLAAVTAIAGAFVAGLRGGHVFNTWPLMGGRVVPPGYTMLSPWVRNWFENPGAAQFDHRCLAYLTVCSVVIFWLISRRHALAKSQRIAVGCFAAAAVGQVCLGIATLLLIVPVPLGIAHQGGAIILITAGLVATHGLRGRTDLVLTSGD
ncbi:MAG TPA: COX15/CtaA family protein [Gemmatimonadales bacterium]|jgi:cytochrome c oxidase assembly protein subunit 15